MPQFQHLFSLKPAAGVTPNSGLLVNDLFTFLRCAFLALLHTITMDEIFVQIQARLPSDLSFLLTGV